MSDTCEVCYICGIKRCQRGSPYCSAPHQNSDARRLAICDARIAELEAEVGRLKQEVETAWRAAEAVGSMDDASLKPRERAEGGGG